MKHLAKPFLVSAALCVAAVLPAHAKMDVTGLKTAIVKSAISSGAPLPADHSPLFAPVPKPTITTGVTARTLAVLSAFDQQAGGK
jgi:hypothetical protein